MMSNNKHDDDHKNMFLLINLGGVGLGIALLLLTKFQILLTIGKGSWWLGITIYPFFILGITNIARAIWEQYVKDIELLGKTQKWVVIYSVITLLCVFALSQVLLK